MSLLSLGDYCVSDHPTPMDAPSGTRKPPPLPANWTIRTILLFFGRKDYVTIGVVVCGERQQSLLDIRR